MSNVHSRQIQHSSVITTGIRLDTKARMTTAECTRIRVRTLTVGFGVHVEQLALVCAQWQCFRRHYEPCIQADGGGWKTSEGDVEHAGDPLVYRFRYIPYCRGSNLLQGQHSLPYAELKFLERTGMHYCVCRIVLESGSCRMGRSGRTLALEFRFSSGCKVSHEGPTGLQVRRGRDLLENRRHQAMPRREHAKNKVSRGSAESLE